MEYYQCKTGDRGQATANGQRVNVENVTTFLSTKYKVLRHTAIEKSGLKDSLLTYTIGRCTRNGKSVGKDVVRNARKFPKCGCLTRFKIDRLAGLIVSGDHSNLCQPLEDAEFQRKGYVMKSLQSPGQQSEFEELAVTCLADWGSSVSDVSQILEKEIMKKSCQTT